MMTHQTATLIQVFGDKTKHRLVKELVKEVTNLDFRVELKTLIDSKMPC